MSTELAVTVGPTASSVAIAYVLQKSSDNESKAHLCENTVEEKPAQTIVLSGEGYTISYRILWPTLKVGITIKVSVFFSDEAFLVGGPYRTYIR